MDPNFITRDQYEQADAHHQALRDTFAAAALTGILANQATTGTASVVIERVARLAYDVADAMMEARLKHEAQP